MPIPACVCPEGLLHMPHITHHAKRAPGRRPGDPLFTLRFTTGGRRSGDTSAAHAMLPRHPILCEKNRVSCVLSLAGVRRCKRLKPTVDVYLCALETGVCGPSVRSKWRPYSFAVDEQSIVQELRQVLKPVGIAVGYYPAAKCGELATMGKRADYSPL